MGTEIPVSYWNGKAFLRFLTKSFFGNRNTNYRLTVKRLGILLLALCLYLPAEILIWSGLFLDEVLHPGYRQIDIQQPIFIIGNPRSGTTFLHRLLARDRGNFLSMHTWEILGAPSIVGRNILRSMAKIIRWLGIRISKRLRKLENLWKENDPIHRLRLRAPEEDEYLFIHIFSTLKIWSYLAMEDEADPYIYFDQKISDADKCRMMQYYRSCIQRHYYSQGEKNRHYLSKNPHFSPAIDTLLDVFPDAKFIYLLRSPLKAIPSHISLKEREWQLLGSPLEEYACRDFIIRSSQYWYEYPLEKILDLPEDKQVVVRFDDLVTDAKGTVEMIYKRLGLEISPGFSALLDLETGSAKLYKSRHHYSLQQMGLEPQSLEDQFAGIIEEYKLRV